MFKICLAPAETPWSVIVLRIVHDSYVELCELFTSMVYAMHMGAETPDPRGVCASLGGAGACLGTHHADQESRFRICPPTLETWAARHGRYYQISRERQVQLVSPKAFFF